MSFPVSTSFPTVARFSSVAKFPSNTSFPGPWTPAQLPNPLGQNVALLMQSGAVTLSGSSITAATAQFGTNVGATGVSPYPTLDGAGAYGDGSGNGYFNLNSSSTQTGAFTLYIAGTLNANENPWAPVGSEVTPCFIGYDGSPGPLYANDDNDNFNDSPSYSGPGGLFLMRVDVDGSGNLRVEWTGSGPQNLTSGAWSFTIDSLINTQSAADADNTNRLRALFLVAGEDIVGTPSGTNMEAWLANPANLGAAYTL
jgi:hypothetical protein